MSNQLMEELEYDELSTQDAKLKQSALDPEPRRVRFLKIDPDLTNEGLLQCHLYASNLEGEYRALSYTWGPERPIFTILVNNKRLKIRQNLYKFLNIARQRYSSKALWVDAVCINQQSVPERNQQVAFMSEIYSCATETLVWLGDSTSNGEDALRNLSDPSSTLAAVNSFPGHPETTSALVSRSQAGVENSFETLMHSLLAFCKLSYWTRTWIVQEYLLSTHIKILCGSVEISPLGLGLLFQNSRWHTDLKDRDDVQILLGSSARALYLSKFKTDPEEESLERSLPWLYIRYRASEAKELHDRVYALRALDSDANFLPVDYSLTPFELTMTLLNFGIRSFGKHPDPRRRKQGIVCYREMANVLPGDMGLRLQPDPFQRHWRRWSETGLCEGIPRFLRIDEPSGYRFRLDNPIHLFSPNGIYTSCELYLREWLRRSTAMEFSSILPSNFRGQLEYKIRYSSSTVSFYVLETEDIAIVARGNLEAQAVIARVGYRRILSPKPSQDQEQPLDQLLVFGDVYDDEYSLVLGGLDETSRSRTISSGLDGATVIFNGAENAADYSYTLKVDNTETGVLLFGLPDSELRTFYTSAMLGRAAARSYIETSFSHLNTCSSGLSARKIRNGQP